MRRIVKMNIRFARAGYDVGRKSKKPRIAHWHLILIYLALYDAFVAVASYIAALFLRFDFRYSQIPTDVLSASLKFAPLYAALTLLVFWVFKLYKSLWRFASATELLRLVGATVVTSALCTVGITLIFGRMPLSYYLIGPVLQFLFSVGIRFSYHFVLMMRGGRASRACGCHILLIGAGNAGCMVIQDTLRSNEPIGKIVCVIDDNPNKWGREIDGVPIVGGREEIFSAVEKYKVDKIFFAIPSATSTEKKEILSLCSETGCELKSLPGISQIVTDQVYISDMKDVAIEDLLGRDRIQLDLEPVYRMLIGKVVMVTGGGGSIGSELCRQIAAHNPKRLIVFDIYENNAYAIEQELRRKYPDLNLTVLIGSVRDSGRLREVFSRYRPQIVYHAAAHKHVPLMETSPCEAIKNNAIGTYKTAYEAMRSGCERFVLISTDKAVNPTNIMGASKRLCEMVIQTFDYMVKHHRENELPCIHVHMSEEGWGAPAAGEQVRSNTRFCAVRFGNVLGSNGSVIPLFKKQIAEGGPVTVTHPDIIRYFMLIPEAVSLVLRASVMGQGSEIYVLDMGEPVKIDTLARNLIRLSGKIPDVDIKIAYTGLRPGEKLYEEKLMAEEGLTKTENDRIHVGRPIPFEYGHFIRQLYELMKTAYAENERGVVALTEQIVTTYHPSRPETETKVEAETDKPEAYEPAAPVYGEATVLA